MRRLLEIIRVLESAYQIQATLSVAVGNLTDWWWMSVRHLPQPLPLSLYTAANNSTALQRDHINQSKKCVLSNTTKQKQVFQSNKEELFHVYYLQMQ